MDLILRLVIWLAKQAYEAVEKRSRNATIALETAHERVELAAHFAEALDQLAPQVEDFAEAVSELEKGFRALRPAGQVFHDLARVELEMPLAPIMADFKALSSEIASDPTNLELLDERIQRYHAILEGLHGMERHLGVLQSMYNWRSDDRLGAMLADADAVAADMLAPLQRHLALYETGFPGARPICAPSDPGMESIWFGLLPEGYPIIFVPDDYDEDLYRHVSLPHEIGHLMMRRVDGLLPELLEVTGVGHQGGQGDEAALRHLFGLWFEEIFADAFAMLLLGPAALRAMAHSFASPDEPQRALVCPKDEHGLADEHPPVHLRVHMAAQVLERMGFLTHAEPSLEWWDTLHGHPEFVYAPVPGVQGLAKIPVSLLLAYNKSLMERWYMAPLKSLGGHHIESIPGFEMTPGVWAHVLKRKDDLLHNRAFNDRAHIVLAAAVEARGEEPDKLAMIAAGLQRAVLGRDAQERRAKDPSYRSRGARGTHHSAGVDTLLSQARDAILLHEILGSAAFRRKGKIPKRAR